MYCVKCIMGIINPIDLFANTAAILDSKIVSDIYYGMLRGQLHTNLSPEQFVPFASHNNYLKK